MTKWTVQSTIWLLYLIPDSLHWTDKDIFPFTRIVRKERTYQYFLFLVFNNSLWGAGETGELGRRHNVQCQCSKCVSRPAGRPRCSWGTCTRTSAGWSCSGRWCWTRSFLFLHRIPSTSPSSHRSNNNITIIIWFWSTSIFFYWEIFCGRIFPNSQETYFLAHWPKGEIVKSPLKPLKRGTPKSYSPNIPENKGMLERSPCTSTTWTCPEWCDRRGGQLKSCRSRSSLHTCTSSP